MSRLIDWWLFQLSEFDIIDVTSGGLHSQALSNLLLQLPYKEYEPLCEYMHFEEVLLLRITNNVLLSMVLLQIEKVG